MTQPKEQVLRVIQVGQDANVIETTSHKFLRSPNVNFNFDKETGFMQRWGKTLADNPDSAPCPEILDIEITSICNGPANKLCGYCYKANTPTGHNMTFAEFKNIIDKMPFLTQIALGADAHGTTNPDMFKMMEYARSKGIIPNLTIASTNEPDIYVKAGYASMYPDQKVIIRRKKTEI